VITALAVGCSLEEPTDISGNVTVSTGDNSLLTEMDQEVFLDEEGYDPGKRPVPVETLGYSIIQIGEIRPTTVSGHTVQANDILISGNRAYVAYNTAGEVFDGAVQIIKITGKSMRIEKEIRFADMDVIALHLQGEKLYFSGMANPDVFEGNRSFIGSIDVGSPKAAAIVDSIVYLNSYAATGIAAYDDKLYVSVGAADGGIEILDSLMTPLDDDPVISADDIRDIEEYSGGVIALAGTTDSVAENGRILIIKDDTVAKEITITDFDSPEAKATIEVNGDYAYLGLSAKGFQVFDLNNENEIFTLPNPDSIDQHVTNSISYNEKLIFSANGEYGFRVLRYTPPAASAEKVGYYSFAGKTDGSGQNYSANHIEYRNRYLFVASGVGGISSYLLVYK
jgi:hypothetical protein